MNIIKHTKTAILISAAFATFAPLPALAEIPKPAQPEKRADQFFADKCQENLTSIKNANGEVDLVFVGDSITDYWQEQPVWKKPFKPRKILNLGISADKTEHVLWRLQHGELDGYKARLFIVMIGTNNREPAPEIAEGIKAILDEIKKQQPQAQILLLGIFPRGEKETDAGRVRNVNVNQLIKKFNGGVVHYLDIGAKFLQPDGTMSKEIMPDFLHPGAKGYSIWAEAIGTVIEELLKEPYSPIPSARLQKATKESK